MSQIRFSIGVPRAGSAARLAEQGPKPASLLPRAACAAADAEQQRAFAPVPVQKPTTTGMRAAGGRVVTAAEMQAAELRARTGMPIDSSLASAEVGRGYGHAMAGKVSPEQQQAFVSTATVPEQVVKESTLSPLEVAAGQIKSLVQSLFSSGVSSSKS